MDTIMISSGPQNPKPPFKLSGERIALLLGGTLIGALVIGFGFKIATPVVKKVCQSILENPDKVGREARVVSVEAVVLKPGTISRRITTVGKLHANESVTLRAEMPGRIKEIAFKEGTMVKKGDVLIQFEDEELQAELVKAEADVEYRQARYDRMLSLQSKGLTKGPDFDQERGQLNMAKAQLEVAKAKLAKATIHAPFDGKIGLIQDVSVGAIVDTQKELVTLVDFDPMKIDFKVPEKFIHDIGVGQTAEVKLDSIPDQNFQATVEAIDSRADPQTHSIAVRATIPNEDGKLQAGLFAEIGVIIGVKNDALILPESALGREGDIEYVWVITNGKTGRKRVLTGTKENGQVEIIAGLRPGEIIVTSGQLKLGEGTAVTISNMGEGDIEVTDEDEDSEDSHESSAPQKEKEGTTEKGEAKSAGSSKGAPEEKTSDRASPDTSAPDTQPKSDVKEEPAAPADAPQGSEKALLPKASTPKSPPTEGEGTAKTGTQEHPADAGKAPDKLTAQPSDETADDHPKTEPEESFFGKARDFIVNIFKGTKKTQ
jgi:membrane fusion protein (multidrug efflux system)